jgi:peptidoglycan/LPS O-acetylase OafA/YrhL
MNSKTFLIRFNETNGQPNGFNYMRVALALGIICFHSIATTTGHDSAVWESWWRGPLAIMLPMFFSLSGFLVAGSLERSKTLFSFLGLRVLRIGPALAGEVLLSAFILGPIFTTYPLSQYFEDALFTHYFWNMVGHIQYHLPGVFLENPYPLVVNGQLWTVPFELACYVSLALFALFGIVKRPVLFLWIAIAYHLFAIPYSIYHPAAAAGNVTGKLLVINFLVGVLFYQYRDRIPSSQLAFWLAFAVSLVLLSFPSADRFSPVFVTYVTVFLGMTNPRRSKLILSGDYSYGLYLYGWPLQQAFAAMAPSHRYWYLSLLVVLPIATLAAVCSWWIIEKPALSLRARLKVMEVGYLLLLDKYFSRNGRPVRATLN